jgi:dephospho-CoA kinase
MAAMGGFVIDADSIARAALDRPEVQAELVRWWGPQVIDGSGKVDRKAVAARVFGHESELSRLEGLIHPIVSVRRAELAAQAQADPQVRFIVMDVPLLFEIGLDRECDRVVFVEADRATRLERLRRSRGWDESELIRREKRQMGLDRKKELADDILSNSADEAECRLQVRRLLDRILETT